MHLSRSRSQARFLILPPAKATVPSIFRNIQPDNRRFDQMCAAVQRFRGSIYLADGAIEKSNLSADGLHRVPIDDESWHVLSLDPRGNVVACLRYLDESNRSNFQNLWVKHAAISRSAEFGTAFRGAVEACLQRTRRQGLRFGEVGGWAVAESHRWTVEPLRIILATYGLLELLGGCSGVATATFRHSSAMILRRIGLSSIVAGGAEVPPYYDPAYRCQMQVLEFDSRRPAEKYRDWVEDLAGMLTLAPVVCRERFVHPLEGVLCGFDIASDRRLVPAAV